MEVHCRYPHNYPNSLPEVHVRCDSMSRSSQKDINEKLHSYLTTFDSGELCMSSVVFWLQEHCAEFIDCSAGGSEPSSPNPHKAKCKYSGLSRLWIYSHHIYRKELLKKIPESAKELDLTGFILPGKPGIICVEGFKENCDEYWQRLKYPNWKHISCKHRDDQVLSEETSAEVQLESFRMFSEFEELAFEAHGDYGLRNDYHMDLGQFRAYLEEHGCQEMFQIFFGLEGKSAEDSKKL